MESGIGGVIEAPILDDEEDNQMPNFSFLMRIVACVAFILAIWGVPWPWQVEVAGGLALWVGSTLVPPGS